MKTSLINSVRRFSTNNGSSIKKGLVLGVFENDTSTVGVELTSGAEKFNGQVNNKLFDLLQITGPPLKKGKSRLFHGLSEEFPTIAVVGLGPKSLGYNELEEVDEKREAIRTAAAIGSRALRDAGSQLVEFDPCGDEEAIAEGASLGLWVYEDLKDKKKHKPFVDLCLFGLADGDEQLWERGLKLGSGQNLARWLMETPANHMTPTIFAKHALEMLGKAAIGVEVHDRAWAERNQMGSFLSVGRGSEEPSLFLELSYMQGDKNVAPIALVGKGVTFDSGGISIKPAAGMDRMRGDMGGAACTFAALKTVSSLGLPVNLKGFIPLCENMPSGRATKPGDVVTAMNGKTIQIDNTDAEGRLILADALCYAQRFEPSCLVDIATLTGAIDVALGSSATGVFTNSTELWHKLSAAGALTGDRVWRMPLWNHFSRQVAPSHLADVNNVGKYAGKGGACTAAAFLKEFVTSPRWMHLDIAGVMENKDEVPYLVGGLTGRPTRTIVEFIAKLCQES